MRCGAQGRVDCFQSFMHGFLGYATTVREFAKYSGFVFVLSVTGIHADMRGTCNRGERLCEESEVFAKTLCCLCTLCIVYCVLSGHPVLCTDVMAGGPRHGAR